MPQVITFEDFQPTSRYDDLPWTEARIEEGATAVGPWTVIETITLDPVDADPEHPAFRSFTTELADDAPDLWYQIVFVDASGDELQPTDPVQNLASADTPFATVEELARILKIRTPTDAQTRAMERVLASAAGEIASEIDRTADNALSGWELALAAEVNLERAVEHWRQQEAAFGILGIGSEFGATHTARDSWERHALKLVPLKETWGLA